MFSGGKHMEHWIKPLSTNPQNGQTHSNNSSAFADELFLSVYGHFAGLALKG